MYKKSKWLTLLSILVMVAILSSGCAKATTAPTQEQPGTAPTEVVPTEPVAPTAVPEKSQIVIVIAEDPPSFNPTINASGFDVLVMELVMLGCRATHRGKWGCGHR
jgi:PBP1b-binding outer membrane lipoprotein LpoB